MLPMTRSASEETVFAGRMLGGRFTLVEPLATDVFATLYRGLDQRSGAEVVVKCIHHDVATAHAEALLDAARSVARLRRARIALVLGATRDPDGTAYIVSERLLGTTLRNVVDQEGPLSPPRVAHILLELCAALAPIHRTGQPHANLKSDNIFLTPVNDGTDVVKITWTGHSGLVGVRSEVNRTVLSGDPRYFSPEQARGLGLTPASDLFTLGTIGYELLTGTLPFAGVNTDQLFAAILRETPAPLSGRSGGDALPEGLEETLECCLAKDPLDRFSAVRVLAHALGATLSRDTGPLPVVAPESGRQAPTGGPGPLAPDGQVGRRTDTGTLIDAARDLSEVPEEIEALLAHTVQSTASLRAVKLPAPRPDAFDPFAGNEPVGSPAPRAARSASPIQQAPAQAAAGGATPNAAPGSEQLAVPTRTAAAPRLRLVTQPVPEAAVEDVPAAELRADVASTFTAQLNAELDAELDPAPGDELDAAVLIELEVDLGDDPESLAPGGADTDRPGSLAAEPTHAEDSGAVVAPGLMPAALTTDALEAPLAHPVILVAATAADADSPAARGTDQARAARALPKELEPDMANIEKTLQAAMEINGCVGAALADWQSGMTLGTAGTGLNMEVAAAGNTDVVRAKMAVMSQLGIPGGIEDILITLTSQYHIIMPTGTTLFMYAALDRKTGNLGLARHQLRALVNELTLA